MKTSNAKLAAVAALALLTAGIIAGSALSRAQAEPTATAAAPEAPLTAYVDFLSLLKDHYPLKLKQVEVAMEMEKQIDDIDKRYLPLIEQQEVVKKAEKPDSRKYRQALSKQIELERQRYGEKLLTEQLAQQELRDEGIAAFDRLKRLVKDIATELGYTQVLNIVRDPKAAVGSKDDFEQLQQQLLISPVLFHKPEHDLTDRVQAKAKEKWDPGIEMGETSAKAGETALVKNTEGEYEIRLGQKVQFAVEVKKKGATATGKDTDVKWTRTGVGSGELDEKSGAYTAPEAFPNSGDKFTVIVRSAIDPTISKRLQIKLLDKDGKAMPAKSGTTPEGE